jgi:hypothetical protein
MSNRASRLFPPRQRSLDNVAWPRVFRTPFGTGAPALIFLMGMAAALIAPQDARAQSATDILTRALEAHDRRLAGVENVTLRQEMMGIPSTAYLVKEMVDGHAVLRPDDLDGMDMDLADEAWQVWTDPRFLFSQVMEHWVLEGAGNVDGRRSWTLSIDGRHLPRDPYQDDEPGWDDDEDFEAERLVMDLDQDRLVPLRMFMEGTISEFGESRPVSVTMVFSDYREVDGFIHPFLTTMEMDMSQAFSPEEVAQARQAMEEFQRQLEQAPEAQREMMEQMMAGQMEMFEQMMAGEAVRMEVRVTELLVNRGPPAQR